MTASPGRHLALLLPELEAGGAQRVMLLLAREFAARGHRVDVVLLRASGALLAEVPADVRLVDLGARGRSGFGLALSSIRRLASWLRRERPDALLGTITGANLVAVLARRLAGVPPRLVINHAAAGDRFGGAIRSALARRLYPQADAVVAMTPAMAARLADQLGLPTDKVRSIPNPIDTAAIRTKSRDPIAHPWLDDPRLKVILSVGRLVPEKDYGTLLRAVALLPGALPARLVIVGEGAERASLEALVDALGIRDRVQLAGFDLNPWRWMSRADLFVLSSRSEGHPIALLEALSLGLPAVVTEYDASVQALAAACPLRRVPVGSPPALAHAIRETLEDEHRTQTPPPDLLRQAVDDYLSLLD